MAVESLDECLCPWGGEDVVERLFQQVAKDYVAVMVEAARYKTAVGKHANLLL